LRVAADSEGKGVIAPRGPHLAAVLADLPVVEALLFVQRRMAQSSKVKPGLLEYLERVQGRSKAVGRIDFGLGWSAATHKSIKRGGLCPYKRQSNN
jgi:hypothetical protein